MQKVQKLQKVTKSCMHVRLPRESLGGAADYFGVTGFYFGVHGHAEKKP